MIIKNIKIINHDAVIENGFIEIRDDKIVNIGQNYTGTEDSISGEYALPGFIDIHIHGTNGHDVMDGTTEALDALTMNLPKEGTTSFLATTLTMSESKLKKAIANIADFKSDKVGAQILGIHLEGPYVNCSFKGAQNEKFIQKPSIESISELLKEADGLVKLVTYAPEKTDVSFTKFLADNNIIPSVGHSGATMSEVLEHVEYGLTNITHFQNRQSGHHHRHPGVVSAGFYSDTLNTELIVDGIHVNKDAVKVVYKVKTKDRILLITDSVRAKGLRDGTYNLGGLDITKSEGAVRTTTGALAGSILSLNDAVKNMMDYTGCTLHEIVSMTSYNQAKLLQVDNTLGTIAPGYDADIVILDKNLNILYTFCKGQQAYKKM